MPHRLVCTPDFQKCLESLARRGKVGKRVSTKAQAAGFEYQTSGEITLPPTHHGETRIPNVTKYDLGDDNYRLVVQSIAGNPPVRAFLFVGSHDEAERWIENHRNCKWVRRKNDKTLDFVLATSEGNEPATLDRTVTSRALPANSPLLHSVVESLRRLPLPAVALDYLLGVTTEDMQRDEWGILENLDRLAPSLAIAAHDLLQHAYRQEWRELDARIAILIGEAEVIEGEDLAQAMLADEAGEQFVQFDDLKNLPEFTSWQKWLVFLSPQQKAFACKRLEGPARLRGVSGSGKTCVLLHRARELVNRYAGKVLVVTSTESMRTLLSKLLDDLCQGMVRKNIATQTVIGLAKDIVSQATGTPAASLIELEASERESILAEIAAQARRHIDFETSELASLDSAALRDFLGDELAYLRSRLRSREYESYLDAQQFYRRGRGRGLSEDGRGICIAAARSWEQQLTHRRVWDPLALVQFALELIEGDEAGLKLRPPLERRKPAAAATFRCTLGRAKK